MTTMLEKAALAIFNRRKFEANGSPPVDVLPSPVEASAVAECIADARAAFLAIREPTEAMLLAADPGTTDEDLPINEAWPRAIDAILNEKPETAP